MKLQQNNECKYFFFKLLPCICSSSHSVLINLSIICLFFKVETMCIWEREKKKAEF